MAFKVAVPNPLVEPGSLILVTGGNGLVASHCVDQAIAAGYKVRTTVRAAERGQWMIPFFEDKYGKGCIEIVAVPDVYAHGCYESAAKGCSLVIHTLPGKLDMRFESAEGPINDEIKTALEGLKAAQKEPSVKSSVLTSSIFAVYPSHNIRGEHRVTKNDWNEASVTKALENNGSKTPPIADTFMAAKVKMEQECWKWIKQNNATFNFNVICPVVVLGTIFGSKDQSLGTTGGWVKTIYDGGPEEVLQSIKFMGTQRFVDAEDNARLHVIAALAPELKHERIISQAGPSSVDRILGVLRRQFPEKKFHENYNEPEDKPIFAEDQGSELLNKYCSKGYDDLETAVMRNLHSFLSA